MQSETVCGPKFGSVPLRSGVRIRDLTGSMIHPTSYSSLDAVAGTAGSGQIVCLVVLKDAGRTTTRKMLRV